VSGSGVVTVIERRAEEVFAVAEDVTKALLREPGLPGARRTSEGPLGAGAGMIYMGTFVGGGGMSRRQPQDPA
jgi:hypothetical protein